VTGQLRIELKPDRWTIETIAKRLEAEGQPWRGIARRARALPRS
jgi:DNA primase